MSEIEEILEAQHKYFYTGETKKLAFRIAMLKRLEEAVIRHEKELLLALQKDLAKAPLSLIHIFSFLLHKKCTKPAQST